VARDVAQMSEGMHVPVGGDLGQERRKVFGSRSGDFEVSTVATNGGFFVVEATDVLKGGPRGTFATSKRSGSTSSRPPRAFAFWSASGCARDAKGGYGAARRLGGERVADNYARQEFLSERVSRISDRIMVSVEEGIRTVLAL
jgi:hypothetical protein